MDRCQLSPSLLDGARKMLDLLRWGMLYLVNPKAAWTELRRSIEDGRRY